VTRLLTTKNNFSYNTFNVISGGVVVIVIAQKTSVLEC